MREVLFRGKRVVNGKWVEGFMYSQHFPLEFRDDFYIRCYDTDYLIIPETVGQYTGLTDKNGVRIFEGDIVKGIAYSADIIGAIVWIDEIASFGVRYFKRQNPTAWENSSILRCASMGKTDEFAAEIIGNIHDNPEILKGGEDNG